VIGLQKIMSLKSTYNRIAEEWHRDHHDDDWWVKGTDTFASLLKPGATILDVGCGAGVKSKYLIEKGFRITGIDFSEKMIEIAKQNVPDGTFSVKDIYALTELSSTFDGVFAQAVLLHIPKKNILAVMKSLADKVNLDGYVYVAVKEKRQEEKEEEIITENDYGYNYERFFSYFTLEEMKFYFQTAGLEIVYENATLNGKRTWIQVVGRKLA
jgi:2-polyprenyl-3-methyl-5-hydroxy-6-metoxy-1,4-benzoquinol methylase